MNYNLILEELDEIYKIISLNKKVLSNLHEDEAILFKKSYNKNLIIEIYTFWENFCKELIYDCYCKYKKIIIDKDFLVNYFEHVQEKSFVRKLFLESIDDNKIDIKKDTLCASNNLNFDQLNDLFKRVRFSKNDFVKHVGGSKNLEKVVKCLQNRSIYPKFNEIKSKRSTIEYVEAYLNLIVEDRNRVAHQYNIVDFYNLEQFQSILDFMKEITFIIFEFCMSQLIKKSNKMDENISKRIFPICVIRSNSGDKTAIIGIKNNTKNIINKDMQLYFYDKNKNIYRMVKILRIVRNEKEYLEMLPTHSYSIEVNTNASIKTTNNRFKIYKISNEYNQFSYEVVV